jgi:hypothetical protein
MDRPHVQRAARQAALLAHGDQLQPHLHAPVLPGPRRHARRIPDYALQFAEFNAISTVGSFVLGLSQLLFAYNIWRCIKGGDKASNRCGKAPAASNGSSARRRPTTRGKPSPSSRIDPEDRRHASHRLRPRAASIHPLRLGARRLAVGLYVVGFFIER